MAPKKTKKYWEDRARRAERGSRTKDAKAKAFEKGLELGLKTAKEAR